MSLIAALFFMIIGIIVHQLALNSAPLEAGVFGLNVNVLFAGGVKFIAYCFFLVSLYFCIRVFKRGSITKLAPFPMVVIALFYLSISEPQHQEALRKKEAARIQQQALSIKSAKKSEKEKMASLRRKASDFNILTVKNPKQYRKSSIEKELKHYFPKNIKKLTASNFGDAAVWGITVEAPVGHADKVALAVDRIQDAMEFNLIVDGEEMRDDREDKTEAVSKKALTHVINRKKEKNTGLATYVFNLKVQEAASSLQ